MPYDPGEQSIPLHCAGLTRRISTTIYVPVIVRPIRVHTCRTEVGACGAPGTRGGACGGEEREGIRTQKRPYRQKGGDTSSGTQAHRKASVYIPLIPFFLASSCHVITLNSLITRPQTRLAPMVASARDRPRFRLHSIRTESA